MEMESWLAEMLAYLSPASGHDLKIEAALRLKDRHIPQRLYRYRAPGKQELERLATGTVWLTSPSHFNDPFDCGVTFDSADMLRAMVQRDFDSALAPLRSGLTDTEYAALQCAEDPLFAAAELLARRDAALAGAGGADQVLRALREAVERHATAMVRRFSAAMRQDLRICCFSSVADSLLMWGLYADKHRGFCVEYAFDRVPARELQRLALYPVVYDDKLFDSTPYLQQAAHSPTDFNNIHFLLASTRKATAWAYEHEWRYVFTPGLLPEGPWRAPKASRVLLGALMDPRFEDELRHVAAMQAIDVVKMELSHKEFRVLEAKPASDAAVSEMAKGLIPPPVAAQVNTAIGQPPDLAADPTGP